MLCRTARILTAERQLNRDLLLQRLKPSNNGGGDDWRRCQKGMVFGLY